MAINVMTLVWEHAPCKGGTLLLFLALADHAHKDGTHVYPGVDTLAEDSRMTERQVRRCLKELEEQGLITKVGNAGGRPGWKNEYKIELEALKKCQGGKNVHRTFDEESDGHFEHEDRTNASPYIEEPSSEPSLNRHSLAEREKDVSTVVEQEKETGEPDPKAWSHAVMEAYWELPGCDRAAPESDAERHWVAIPWADRPETDELIDCIRAYRADLLRINSHRPADKPQMVRYLGNWIKDRCYAGFLQQVRDSPKRIASKVAKATGNEHRLDETSFEALKAAGISENDIVAWFADAEILRGPPAVVLLKHSFRQETVINRYMGRLRKAFGDDVAVEVAGARAA